MGKLAEALQPQPRLCRFGEILTEYADPEDLAVVDDVDNVTNAAIHEFVSTNWVFVGRTVVSEHRRRACLCYRGVA